MSQENPPLKDLEYVATEVVKLRRTGDKEQTREEYAEELAETVPLAGVHEVAAHLRWMEIVDDLYDFLKRLVADMMNTGSTVAPNATTLRQVIEAIPEDWDERDEMRRSIILAAAIDRLLRVDEGLRNEDLDLDFQTENALEEFDV